MLKTGSSGGIYIHPWDITDEGIDTCYDFLGEVCGLNELFVAAAYHAGTFILPHNPKRMVRWDDGGIYFRPQHPRWSATRIRPPGNHAQPALLRLRRSVVCGSRDGAGRWYPAPLLPLLRDEQAARAGVDRARPRRLGVSCR